jgi:hypothetical protein
VRFHISGAADYLRLVGNPKKEGNGMKRELHETETEYLLGAERTARSGAR